MSLTRFQLRAVLPVLLVPCAGLLACTEGELNSAAVDRVDSLGVEVLTASGQDRPLSWSFRPLFTLGGEARGPESFYAVSPRTVAADTAGHLYVLDTRARRIVVFDRAGRLIRSFGSEGAGPGEMRSPGSISVSGAGGVAVFDFGKGNLVRYDPDRSVLPELSFRHYPRPNLQRHFAHAEDGFLVSTTLPPTLEGERRAGLLRIRDADTVHIAQVTLPPFQMVRYPSCGGGLNLPPLFAPELVWDRQGEQFVVAVPPRYIVNVYHGERLVRSIRRPLEPQAGTRELALRELGQGFQINFGRGPCTIPPDEMVTGRGYAALVPVIETVRLSPEGWLWIQRRVIGAAGRGPIDIFDSRGTYVGTLKAGTAMPLVLIPGRRAALEDRDAFDVERILVVEVER